MSSLTAAVQRADSPVGRWMRHTFPHLAPLQRAVRDAVGIYAARFGCLVQWPLAELLQQATGRTGAGLLALRQEFGDLLHRHTGGGSAAGGQVSGCSDGD